MPSGAGFRWNDRNDVGSHGERSPDQSRGRPQDRPVCQEACWHVGLPSHAREAGQVPARVSGRAPVQPRVSAGSPGPAGALLASRPGGCWVRGGLAVRSWRGRRTPCAALWLLPVAAAWPCHQEVGGALAGAGPCCFQSARPGSCHDTPETWLPSVSGTKLGRMTTRSSEVPSACELPGLTPRATGRS